MRSQLRGKALRKLLISLKSVLICATITKFVFFFLNLLYLVRKQLILHLQLDNVLDVSVILNFRCLSRDPYIRPSMRDILRDRFMLDCFVNDDSGRSLYRFCLNQGYLKM